jgi:uncharacterized membrane protein
MNLDSNHPFAALKALEQATSDCYLGHMTLDPLLNAPPEIQFHAIAAFLALVLGILQLALPKGNPRHRIVGYIWVASMLIVAISSFWIHTIQTVGLFSPIHILSVFTLLNVPYAVWAARRGNIKAHRRAMLSLFWLALVGAGLFTLLPNRIMGQVFFGT